MQVRQVVLSIIVVLSVTGCVNNPNTLGLGVLGAGGGGYAGSLFGKGQGKILATAGGTALGGLVGAFLGQKFDQTNDNAAAIRTLYQRSSSFAVPSQVPAPIVYHSPSGRQSDPSVYRVPMTCQVINNQVRCNGQ